MLPKLVYEPLPYFYIALGGVLTITLDSSLKYLPVALFICAGLLVLSMRRYFRRDLDRQRQLRTSARRRRSGRTPQAVARVERSAGGRNPPIA